MGGISLMEMFIWISRFALLCAAWYVASKVFSFAGKWLDKNFGKNKSKS